MTPLDLRRRPGLVRRNLRPIIIRELYRQDFALKRKEDGGKAMSGDQIKQR